MTALELDPAEALRRAGGLLPRGELVAVCGAAAVRRDFLAGRIVRPFRGRYALPVVAEAPKAAHRLGGVVSGLSAAQAWEWEVKAPPAQPVVTVPPWRRRSEEDREGVDVRWRVLPPEAISGGVVTTRVQTVVDCARDLPFDEALCVADSALRHGDVDRGSVLAAALASPRTGRSRAVRVAQLADGRAANPFESCLRATCLGIAQLEVEPQVWVEGVGRVDLADLRLRLAIEADSHEFHSERQAFRRDVRRYTALVRCGWTVIRFCWEDVMHRPDYVAAVLRDLVRLGPRDLDGYRPSGRDLRL